MEKIDAHKKDGQNLRHIPGGVRKNRRRQRMAISSAVVKIYQNRRSWLTTYLILTHTLTTTCGKLPILYKRY